MRGPLTVTDIMGYHIGTGWGGFGVRPARLAWKQRQRMPKLFEPNSQGVPDTVQRCHWEDEWAQSLGQPLAYDYGAMRSNWTTGLIRNWMGDSGWLWQFESRIRRFNHRGDTTWISGTVTAVDTERRSVDVEIEGINQRGTQTCSASATILLPAPGETRPAIRRARVSLRQNRSENVNSGYARCRGHWGRPGHRRGYRPPAGATTATRWHCSILRPTR